MFRTSWVHHQGDVCVRSMVCFTCIVVEQSGGLESRTLTYRLSPQKVSRMSGYRYLKQDAPLWFITTEYQNQCH